MNKSQLFIGIVLLLIGFIKIFYGFTEIYFHITQEISNSDHEKASSSSCETMLVFFGLSEKYNEMDLEDDDPTLLSNTTANDNKCKILFVQQNKLQNNYEILKFIKWFSNIGIGLLSLLIALLIFLKVRYLTRFFGMAFIWQIAQSFITLLHGYFIAAGNTRIYTQLWPPLAQSWTPLFLINLGPIYECLFSIFACVMYWSFIIISNRSFRKERQQIGSEQ